MIEVPGGISDGVFAKEFKRGAVIRTLYQFRDGTRRNKYIVVLNHNAGGQTIIFVFTTSQTDYYKKHPHFNKDILVLDPGALPIFSKETVIDCRRSSLNSIHNVGEGVVEQACPMKLKA